MTDTPTTIYGVQVLNYTSDGKKLQTELDAVDLIGDALGYGIEIVILPVEWLDDDFFQLKTGLAGQIVQKFVTYRRRLVVLGDISDYIAQSRSFKAFVYEANRGNQIWFITKLEELNECLKRIQ